MVNRGVLQIMDMVPWVVGLVDCGMTQASSMVVCVLLSTLQFEMGEHESLLKQILGCHYRYSF